MEPETIKQISPQLSELSKSLQSFSATLGQNKLPTQTEAPSITSETLSPSEPLDTSFEFDDGAPGLLGFLQGFRQNLTTQAEKEEEKRRKDVESRQSEFERVLEEQAGVERERSQRFEQEIAPKEIELDELTAQIEARELSLRREIEEIRQKPGGTVAGMQDAVRAAQRRGAAEIADLSIIQAGKARHLMTATTLMDRAIDIKLAPIKEKKAFLENLLDKADTALTTAEKRTLQSQKEENDSTIKILESEFKGVYNTALEAQQAGAPNHIVKQILSSGSQIEAQQLAQPYMQRAPATTVDPEATTYEQWWPSFLQTEEGQRIARQFGKDNIGLAKELRRIHAQQFGTGAEPIKPTPTQRQDLTSARLDNASQDVQQFFLRGTTSTFRQEWIRKVATGGIDVSDLTVQDMQEIYDEWEGQKSRSSSSSSSSVPNLYQ